MDSFNKNKEKKRKKEKREKRESEKQNYKIMLCMISFIEIPLRFPTKNFL